MPRRLLVLAASLALTLACAATAPDAPALRDKRFVLLGEVHDNPAHHRQRAELLRELLADGRPTRVVFEQMPRGRDGRIAAAPRDAEAVADAGALDRAAWRWPLHKPLVEAALAGGATIAGGNLEREAVRAIVRDGNAALPPDLRPRLAADTWTATQEQRLQALIDEGHCGTLPEAMRAPMALAQRARDAALAQAMLQAPAGERVVLIAGNGHVRRDVGVPHYLRAAGVPPSQIATVGYLERGEADDGAAFDRVRVTEAAARADPCAALRR